MKGLSGLHDFQVVVSRDVEVEVDLRQHRPMLSGEHHDGSRWDDSSSSRTTGAFLMASGRVPGSEVSRRDLLQRRLLQLRISEQPLQRGVSRSRSFNLLASSASSRRTGSATGSRSVRDTQLAADVGDVPALGQQPISLGRKAGVDCRIVRRRCSRQRLDW